MIRYRTTETRAHDREEEEQWAALLAQGDDVRGMLLVFIQKLCTAFHELAPAVAAHAVVESEVPFFRDRMVARIEKVLAMLDAHDLGTLDGADALRALLEKTRAAGSLRSLADLAEPVHQVNHILCDALLATADS